MLCIVFRDGMGNTTEENSSISLILLPTATTCGQ